MIKFLLEELEKSPNPIFSKKELLGISRQDFENLRKKKILIYHSPSESDLERINLPRCQHGCSLTIFEFDGKLEATCLEHPEEDPVPVVNDNLNRYAVSVEELLFEICRINNIEGDISRLKGSFFYLGKKYYSNFCVGFIFVHKIGDEELIKLSGIKHLCQDDDIIVVFTPATKVSDPILKKHLHHEKIIQASLASTLAPETFELPLEKLLRGITGKEKSGAQLTAKQKADYIKHKYLCLDKVHIPGTFAMAKSNIIKINKQDIQLGDSSFMLFLRLAVELKKNKGGWISIYTLESEKIIADASRYQYYSSLRKQIEGYLIEKDANKFIQNDGSKHYRISTHPVFITCDKKSLLKHTDERIKKLAKEL